VVRHGQSLALGRPRFRIGERGNPVSPLVGRGRELEPVLADDCETRHAHDPGRIHSGSAAHAREQPVAALEPPQLGSRLIRDDGVLGARHDRCESPVDIEQQRILAREVTGAEMLMWSSDYPHHDAEDVWESLRHMAELGVPAEAQRKLLGENARRLYGIEPVMTVKERIEKYEPAILPW
jgi:hypothetical protein